MTPIAEVQTISDVETIKVLADERRLAILQALEQPLTVKELAARLDTPPSQLYYHVNLLEKHGVIRVVDSHIVSGIIEKFYQVTARRFHLRNPMLMGDAITPAESATLFTAVLDETKKELQKAFQLAPPRQEGTPPLHPFVTKKEVRLTPEQLVEFHARLDGLTKACDELTQAHEGSNTPIFHLNIVFYQMPLVDPTSH